MQARRQRKKKTDTPKIAMAKMLDLLTVVS